MDSIDLIRDNLKKSAQRTLLRIDEMREYAMVFPTPRGGAHTLWTLGHLAYIESLVIQDFMLGKSNPLARWATTFDGSGTSDDPDDFPPFDEVLDTCREMRKKTIDIADALAESDLDKPSANTPKGYEDTFGTWRLCLQYVADHWYMHRGQLADARRAAGQVRMWV